MTTSAGEAEKSRKCLSAALEYRGYGIATLPLGLNNRPVGIKEWKPLQFRLSEKPDLESLFSEAPCLGVIGGQVSGNLEIIDVDTKNDLTGNLWQDFSGALRNRLGSLYSALVIAGTRSGGYHIFYRCPEGVGNNDKLAKRDATPEEKADALSRNTKNRIHDKTIIETRGEGGYVAAFPSPKYKFIQGDLSKIPVITGKTRQVILEEARRFHTATRQANHEAKIAKAMRDPFVEIEKPEALKRFDREGDVLGMLIDSGWEIVSEDGDKVFVRRPGESTNTQSGNYHKLHRTLVIHSSNTDFDPEWPYYPSEVYAILETEGDIHKAAVRLDRFYGAPEKSIFDGERKNDRAGMRAVGLSDILSKPAPAKWLIKDFVNRGALVQLFGASNAGKSFVAIDWALSIASGTAWAEKEVFNPGAVVYVAGEGIHGISKRVKAWFSEHPEANPSKTPFYRSSGPTALLDPKRLEETGRMIEDVAKEHGSVAMVIIDTLNRNFGDGNENSTEDMTKVVAAADKIIQKFGCAVCIVHHTGHGSADRARGSGALRAATDFEYAVERRGDTTVIRCKKTKDFDPAPDVFLRSKKVDTGWIDDETGEPIESLVFTRIEEEQVVIDEELGRAETDTTKPTGDGKEAYMLMLRMLRESIPEFPDMPHGAVSWGEFRRQLREKWSEIPDSAFRQKVSRIKRYLLSEKGMHSVQPAGAPKVSKGKKGDPEFYTIPVSRREEPPEDILHGVDEVTGNKNTDERGEETWP